MRWGWADWSYTAIFYFCKSSEHIAHPYQGQAVNRINKNPCVCTHKCARVRSMNESLCAVSFNIYVNIYC